MPSNDYVDWEISSSVLGMHNINECVWLYVCLHRVGSQILSHRELLSLEVAHCSLFSFLSVYFPSLIALLLELASYHCRATCYVMTRE
nr:hypothetical protein Iba_chr04cCG0210 [Ipomoea batatas]